MLGSIGLSRSSALTLLLGGVTGGAHAGRLFIALWLVLGAFDLVGRALGAADHVGATFTGAKVAWPAALVLSSLALVDLLKLQSSAGGHLGAAIAIAATLALAVCVDRRSPTRIPFLATPVRLPGPWPGVWEIALLVVSLAFVVGYLRIGSSAEGNFQNDSAYYYGVARHIAMARRFEEPIVWHFVAPPPAIIHAPFDYWGGLTSVVLAPVLALFGPNQHTAFVAMAAISGLSVIAFWYLVCVALPVRYAVLQLFALVAFALSPSAHAYRFDTESLPLYHLLLIVALIGIATDRPRLAVIASFLLVVCRVDGMALFAGTVLVVVLHLRRRGRVVELRRAAVLGGGLFAVYLARNLWAFRTLMPPGSSSGALLKDQLDLYSLHRHPPSALGAIAERLELDYVLARIDLLVDNLRSQRMLPAQPLWYFIALLPGILYFRRRSSAASTIQVATVAALFVLTWASGPMFHGWRTLSALLPMVVLSCALGASMIFDGLVVATRWARRAHAVWSVVVTLAFFVVAVPVAARVEPYGPRARAALKNVEIELAHLDAVLGGAPVAATSPWYVMAQTRSPVVSIPEDGEASIAEVIRLYGVEWLLLPTEFSYMRGSASVLRELQSGVRTRIGSFAVERVPAAGSVAVFHVRR